MPPLVNPIHFIHWTTNMINTERTKMEQFGRLSRSINYATEYSQYTYFLNLGLCKPKNGQVYEVSGKGYNWGSDVLRHIAKNEMFHLTHWFCKN